METSTSTTSATASTSSNHDDSLPETPTSPKPDLRRQSAFIHDDEAECTVDGLTAAQKEAAEKWLASAKRDDDEVDSNIKENDIKGMGMSTRTTTSKKVKWSTTTTKLN